MTELPTQTLAASDGTPLAYLELGEGRPVVLLHGYLMTAHEAWVRPGIAERLGIADYDLGGYSLGSVTVARMLVRGARPGRAMIGGSGLEPIIHMEGRGGLYRHLLVEPDSAEPGTFEDRVNAYLERIGADRVALRRVLDTFVDTPVESLGRVEVPMLLLFGDEEDKGRGSVEDLAAAFPRATVRRVPGDHGTAPRSPEFADALVRFLQD